jgi:hypothetical protein
MGYTSDVFIIFGVQIPLPKLADGKLDQTGLHSVLRKLFPAVDFDDDEAADDFWNCRDDYKIVTLTGTYEFLELIFQGQDNGCYIALDSVQYETYPVHSEPQVIVPPSDEAKRNFLDFLASRGINYPYAQFISFAGGS